MTIDYGTHDGRICVFCMKRLEEFFSVRYTIKRAEELYLENPADKIEKLKPSQPRPMLQSKKPQNDLVEVQAKSLLKRSQSSSNGSNSQFKPKYKCKICQKNFSSKNVLKIHIESIHQRIKKFDCDLCYYSTYWKQQIKKHFLQKHPRMHLTAIQ